MRTLVASPQAIELVQRQGGDARGAGATRRCRSRSCSCPRACDEFVDGAQALGYPDAPGLLQAAGRKGSRGFRILRAHVDKVDLLLNARPATCYMTLDEFAACSAGVEPFPTLMLMEYVDGAGVHRRRAGRRAARSCSHQTKTREAIDTGLAMAFKTVDRPDLMEAARARLRQLDLDWFVNIQFKGDSLLEVNPRVSTFVYQEDFILPYLGIKYALGELSAREVAGRRCGVRAVAAHGALLRPGVLGRVRRGAPAR